MMQFSLHAYADMARLARADLVSARKIMRMWP